MKHRNPGVPRALFRKAGAHDKPHVGKQSTKELIDMAVSEHGEIAVEVDVVTETTKTHTAHITRRKLLQALGIPEGARVYVEVPSGGDWSGCDLDIEHGQPIIVSWQTHETK